MQVQSAGRSLPAWRTLQGRLVLSLIFVLQTSYFSHLGQEKCETWQQSDQAAAVGPGGLVARSRLARKP